MRIRFHSFFPLDVCSKYNNASIVPNTKSYINKVFISVTAKYFCAKLLIQLKRKNILHCFVFSVLIDTSTIRGTLSWKI